MKATGFGRDFMRVPPCDQFSFLPEMAMQNLQVRFHSRPHICVVPSTVPIISEQSLVLKLRLDTR